MNPTAQDQREAEQGVTGGGWIRRIPQTTGHDLILHRGDGMGRTCILYVHRIQSTLFSRLDLTGPSEVEAGVFDADDDDDDFLLSTLVLRTVAIIHC